MTDLNLPTDAYTDADGAVFVQAAPGKETHFIGGCFDAGDLPNPKSDVEPIYCLTADRMHQAVGATVSAPGKVTSTITGLVEDSANWLELFAEDFCPFFLHFVQHKCGTRGVWAHWERIYTYMVRAITDDPISGFMSRAGGNPTTRAVNWTAYPPRVSSRRLGIGMKTATTSLTASQVIWAEPKQCATDCGPGRRLGEVLYFSDSTAGGPVVHRSADFGETWTATTSPFGAGEIIEAAVAVVVDRNTTRQICFRRTDGANPFECGYSDDNGATWTNVNIAAAGTTGVMTGASQAAFAIDQEHIWVGDDSGEIYFSADGGLTWAAQGAVAAMGGNDVYSIHFYDANIGVAAGQAGVVIATIDGGTNWAAVGVPAAQIINSIRMPGPSSQVIICGNIVGDVYVSWDFGTTWTQTWGTGTVIQSLDSASPTVHFLIDDPGASDFIYQSVDGGLTWQQYATPTNTGLSHILVLSPTLVFAVGLVQGTTPAIIKLGQGVS